MAAIRCFPDVQIRQASRQRPPRQRGFARRIFCGFPTWSCCAPRRSVRRCRRSWRGCQGREGGEGGGLEPMGICEQVFERWTGWKFLGRGKEISQFGITKRGPRFYIHQRGVQKESPRFEFVPGMKRLAAFRGWMSSRWTSMERIAMWHKRCFSSTIRLGWVSASTTSTHLTHEEQGTQPNTLTSFAMCRDIWAWGKFQSRLFPPALVSIQDRKKGTCSDRLQDVRCTFSHAKGTHLPNQKLTGHPRTGFHSSIPR